MGRLALSNRLRVGLTCLALATWLAGCESSGVVEARRFVLVDKAGRRAAELGFFNLGGKLTVPAPGTAGGGGEFGGEFGVAMTPGMALFHEGRMRAALALEVDGSPAIVFLNDDGRQILIVGLTQEGAPALTFYDDQGRPTTRLPTGR